LHCQRELFLQRRFLSFFSRINCEMKWHGLRFAANGQFHLVIARQRQRALRSRARIESARNLNRIIVTQVPLTAVHSFVSWNCLYALYAIRPLRRSFTFFLFLARNMPPRVSRRI